MLAKAIQEEKNFLKSSSIGSYWITTFGCQMNKADSERMAGILEKMGYSRAIDELKACCGPMIRSSSGTLLKRDSPSCCARQPATTNFNFGVLCFLLTCFPKKL